MSNTLRSAKSSQTFSSDNFSQLSVGAKLKRLRLEENILYKALLNTASKDFTDESKVSLFNAELEYSNYACKLKMNVNELNKIFEDLKCISVEDNLKEVDVDDVKKDVMELDTKICTLKTFLKEEIAALRCDQGILEQQIEDSAASIKNSRRRGSAKLINKQFVVSPVKNIMNTPFKCLEVQQYQDFMANNGRYGGWNEYNHLIFVKLWKNTYGDNLFPNSIDETVETSELYAHFLHEVLQNVLGPTKDDIVEHTRWYCKYLYLKHCQQKALAKWKSAKDKIRNCIQKTSSNKKKVNSQSRRVQKLDKDTCPGNIHDKEIDETSDDSEISLQYLFFEGNVEDFNKDTNFKNENKNELFASVKYDKLNYLKPTKQWTYRSIDDEASSTQTLCSSVDEIPKTAIPNWRIGLY